MAGFNQEQLAQLRLIQEGERYHTEQLIKKHTKPILDKVTRIEAVQLEDRKDAREDTGAVASQFVDLDKRVTRIENVNTLEPISVK